MIDFVKYKYRTNRDTSITVYPDFVMSSKVKDLMIKGRAFYAVWDEELGLWSRNPNDALDLIDKYLWKFVDELKVKFGTERVYDVKAVSDFSSGKGVEWEKYLKTKPDNYVELDDSVTFQDKDVVREDYVSKKLPYTLSEGDTPNYDLLMSTLYSEEERAKIEWSIGAIFTGASKSIQKFIVLYGEGGTGKSTVLNIIQQLFEGYYATFEAKSLANSNSQFALEQFKSNPLVAIQHDGNLSRIEDNSRLNSLISHEPIVINEKHKAQYTMTCHSFLYMGTNKPVMITDAKSGIIRRLIDVRPTGNTLPFDTYIRATNGVKFELGAIAQHCIDVYEDMGPDAYLKYKPTSMFGATNDMYNFIYDHYDEFVESDYITLNRAWTMYKEYVEDAKIQYPFNRRVFKAELGNYFGKFDERVRLANGDRARNVFREFKADKFVIHETSIVDLVEHEDKEDAKPEMVNVEDTWLDFNCTKSRLDDILADCPAQYASKKGTPQKPWSEVTTKLKDLDTTREHYVLPPDNYIVIDFDIRGEDGEKNMEMNRKAAEQFPPTYGEYSKSGGGIHLHYIYNGDLDALSRVYGDNIEIKVFRGNAALRRRLSYCNSIFIATISAGLPLKGEKKMLNTVEVQDEKHLRARIKNCLLKKHHGHTAPEVNYIYETLETAYRNDVQYDVSDMRKAIKAFCLHSTNQPKQCMRLYGKMHFKSAKYEYGDKEGWDFETESARVAAAKGKFEGLRPLIIFDIEVFPNLYLICWKEHGKDKPIAKWFNPTPDQVEWLMSQDLVGFNNKAYDNHILYAIYLGKKVDEIYHISKDLIASVFSGYGPAHKISKADIYDIAAKKQSLKKWELELAAKGKLVHHQELGFRWDEPVPEDKWHLVAEYCCNDVLATEAVWDEIQEDVRAREILSKISGLSMNERSRAHAARFIFGLEKHPRLVYTDLATGKRTDGTCDVVSFPGYEYCETGIDRERYGNNKIVSGKSIYKGQDPGEGGFVYAEPGMHYNVALLDVSSMHPSSMIAENIFGDYTERFKGIVEGRIAIKHKDIEKLKTLLDGVFVDYVGSDEEMDTLATALKLVINSVYGYTTATFDNPFKDPRNKDNIVAKRGALFMIDLKEEVQKRGFTVAHIKTDSIKIPNATPEIIQFVMEFGKKYGYTFEHEATYERMCLVNESTYIAKYDEQGIRVKKGKHANEWTATGKQFQIPYIFKSLFSHEEITLEDLCETRSVSTAMYLDMNEDLGEGEHNYIFVGRVGQFCPVVNGVGGGILVREKKDRSGYDSVNGTKGFRWLESEIVRERELMDKVDRSYYNKLADEAVETISKFGNFERFVNESVDYYVNEVPFMNQPETNDISEKENDNG